MSHQLKEVSIKEFNRHYGKNLDKVHESGNPIILTRHGNKVAAIVPIEYVPNITGVKIKTDISHWRKLK